MGRVECFTLAGVDCWFFSSDHTPEHFHARSRGEWEVKILFLRQPIEVEVVWQVKRIPGSVMRDLAEIAEKHRSALFSKWSRKVAQE